MDDKSLAFVKGFICLNKVVESVSESIRLNYGLTKKELCIIINTYQRKNIHIKELSEILKTSVSLTSKILKSLKSKNIIETISDSNDKRIQFVVLTNYGYELLDQVVNYINSILPLSVLETVANEGEYLINLSDSVRNELILNKK